MKKLLTSFLFILVASSCANRAKTTSAINSETVETTPDSETFPANCHCKKIPELMGSCDTLRMTNGAMLYEQLTCDSVWLTFEYAGKKKILHRLEADMIEYLDHLDFTFMTEYENSFLMEESVATGWDTPVESVLFDKKSGNVIQNFGPVLFSDGYDESIPKRNFIAYFKNEDYNSVMFYNLITGKIKEIKLKSGAVKSALEKAGEVNVYNLVSTSFEGETIKIDIAGEMVVFNFEKF